MKDEVKGLGTQPRHSWPKLTAAEARLAPIDMLKPTSDKHKHVLDYLVARLSMSENKMAGFYPRWRTSERRIQAYINHNSFEQTLKANNENSYAPAIISIQVPYSFAVLNTITTYLLHTFCSRKPMFQIGTHKGEAANAAQMMEIVLQYNADHIRLIKHFHNWFTDAGAYGVGVLRTGWKKEKRFRTTSDRSAPMQLLNNLLPGMFSRKRSEVVTYEGNDVANVDPFLFFPDPRVPMHEVNRKGEFVFWRDFVGKHELKIKEHEGVVKWVDSVGSMPRNNNETQNDSARAILAGGDSNPGYSTSDYGVGNFIQVDQGSCIIIPAELGLGDTSKPELWLFTIANKTQIIQAERLEYDHGMHPVCVTEPLTMGRSFGNLGMSDYIGPLQDAMSWMFNSHIYNVRSVLNNMFVVDPSMVEMQDVRKPGPGKYIRLKRSAYGQDVRMAIQQLQVQDVTGSHIKDMQLVMGLGERLSAVTDNLLGIQADNGRKTATEVRVGGESASSRLAAYARVVSAQGVCDLTEQMALNVQQFLSDKFYIEIVGEKGIATPLKITPESLNGDFNFPVHDGTLPIDKIATLDIWKEILMGVAQDQELRQTFSLPKIFEFVAELGGARNIQQMKVQVAPDQQLQAQAQAGNAVPLGGMQGGAPQGLPLLGGQP